MKKSHLLLPLVAALGLVGCSSNTSTATMDGSDESQIAASVDAAANNAGINNGSWMAGDITPTSMPSSMNQTVTTPSYGQVTASTAPGVVSQPAPTVSAASQAPHAVSPAAQPTTAGNCEVVRDSSGTPVYSQMIKGCYTGSYYTVGSQDTLFLISFLTGQSPAQIAELNGISTTSKLTVGRSLRVR